VSGAQSRLWTMRPRRQHLLVAFALATLFGAVIAGMAQASPRAIASAAGQLTFSGATTVPDVGSHGTFPLRCSRFDGNTDLSTTVHGIVLDLSVGSVNGGLPAKGTANLAKTNGYEITFEGGPDNWFSGYAAHGHPKHQGSGTLSFSNHGKSGKLDTEMASIDTPPGQKIHVTATWRCG
jgi:hypothetical protein